MDAKTNAMAERNDAFRANFSAGTVLLSARINAMDFDFQTRALHAVRYVQASGADDPTSERDLGFFTVGDQRLCWKINYYEQNDDYGPPDEDGGAKTRIVMTIMLAEEWPG
jgi:hypothetical protein